MTDKDENLINGLTVAAFIRQCKEETSAWYSHLDKIIGGLAFTLGLASASTKFPEIYGGISLVFVFLVWWKTSHNFPPTIKWLKSKRDKSDIEEVILKGLEAHIFSLRKTFFEAPGYWLGFLFLMLVVLGLDTWISNIYKQIK